MRESPPPRCRIDSHDVQFTAAHPALPRDALAHPMLTVRARSLAPSCPFLPQPKYLGGQVINQLEDTTFFCNQDEFVLTLNSTEACEDCESQGADAPPVCVENVRRANDNNSACGYCQYTSGESFLEFYSMDRAPVNDKWANVGYVAIWLVAARAVTVLGLVCVRHYTR